MGRSSWTKDGTLPHLPLNKIVPLWRRRRILRSLSFLRRRVKSVSFSRRKLVCLPVLMGEPSLKNGSLPFYPNVEEHQQKGWEKMDSDEDEENFPRNKLNIVGLGKLKNKIIQARRRERNRL